MSLAFKFQRFEIQGLVLIKPDIYQDGRGFFKETYKKSIFQREGIGSEFLQDNYSLSSKGILRGLHYQLGSHSQGKLVSVSQGEVWDVAVDIRKSSPTFGKWMGISLSSENCQILWIPPGFAHGFVVLSETAIFQYKCTSEYHKASEGGIVWNDRELNIQWPIKEVEVSDKDAILPIFKNAEVFN